MRAAYKGHMDVVKTLVRSGTDITATNNYGHSAIVLAATAGHTEIVAFLRSMSQSQKPTERLGKRLGMRR